MSITDIAGTTETTDTPTEGTATIDLTGRTQPATSRPTFTITDAAAACAVSRKTITRKLADLALHGAAKDEDGIWRIPVEALLAVGLHPGRSLPPTQPAPRAAVTSPSAHADTRNIVSESAEDLVSVPRARWDDLRIRLARAEAEATERALALADARLALRALTAGPTHPSDGPAPVALGSEGGPVPVPLPGPAIQEQAVPSHAGPERPAAPPGASGQPAAPGQDAATQEASAQLAAARSHAAQNGGYVPAAAAPRKRRWWQSK